jgi:preprotein translocase subunit YajC
MGLLLILVMFGAMWFFMIRPQQQRLKNQRLLVMNLSVGDEIVTAGGVIGTITAVADREITIDTGHGQRLRVVRTAVSGRLAPELPAGPVDGPIEEG